MDREVLCLELSHILKFSDYIGTKVPDSSGVCHPAFHGDHPRPLEVLERLTGRFFQLLQLYLAL